MELFIDLLKLLVAGMIGAFTQVVIARYSKPKAERDSGLVHDYINIADMTGAQLERKINQIDKLEKEIDAIKEARAKREIESQAERDELKVKIQSDLIETREIRMQYLEAQKRIAKLEDSLLLAVKYIDAIDKGESPPQLNGLLDSVRKMKLTREQQDLLKAGK